MPIIDNHVHDLVREIETSELTAQQLDQKLRRLVLVLTNKCGSQATRLRYAQIAADAGVMEKVPMGIDGYTRSFDVLTEEEAFIDHWRRHGIVASWRAIKRWEALLAETRVADLVLAVSEGQCDLSKPDTWKNMPVDAAGTELISRGFLEIYHDHLLATFRQSLRAYLHFVLVWGRADLWCTFDRLGVKLPGHKESQALPLHVDQNPNVHPDFRTVQGVLALSDCPVSRGTFVGVPGSKKHFGQYGPMAKNAGEYVELDLSAPIAPTLAAGAQLFPLEHGDLITWDSRTTHANSANVSDETRIVAYIAAGIAKPDDQKAVAARAEAFRTGEGSNVRDAYMHASKRPRYTNLAALGRARTPENLTLLGRLLYGQQTYASLE